MADNGERSDSPISTAPDEDDSQMGHGHFFVKKTFHKPTYCHHCTDILWGLIGVGYVCEGECILSSYGPWIHTVSTVWPSSIVSHLINNYPKAPLINFNHMKTMLWPGSYWFLLVLTSGVREAWMYLDLGHILGVFLGEVGRGNSVRLTVAASA